MTTTERPLSLGHTGVKLFIFEYEYNHVINKRYKHNILDFQERYDELLYGDYGFDYYERFYKYKPEDGGVFYKMLYNTFRDKMMKEYEEDIKYVQQMNVLSRSPGFKKRLEEAKKINEEFIKNNIKNNEDNNDTK